MSQGFFSVGTVGNRCWFYCLPDETAEGPCTMQKLRKAFQRGYLNRSTLVWNGETVEAWTPVDKVPGLLRQLRVRDGRRRRSSTSTVSAESEIEEEEKTGVYRPLPPSAIEDHCTTSSSSSGDETGLSHLEDGFSSDGRGPLLKVSKTSQAVGKLALKEMASLTLSMHFSGHPKPEPDLRKIRTTSFDLGVPSELSWRDSDTLPSRTPTITHTPTTATTMTATTSGTSGTVTLRPRKSSSVSVSRLADRVGSTRLTVGTPSREDFSPGSRFRKIELTVADPSMSPSMDCPSPLTIGNLHKSAGDLSSSSLTGLLGTNTASTPGASSTAALVDPKDDMVRLGSMIEDTLFRKADDDGLDCDSVLPEIRELEHAMDSSFPVSFGMDTSDDDEEIRFRESSAALSSTGVISSSPGIVLGAPPSLTVRLSNPSVNVKGHNPVSVSRRVTASPTIGMTGSVSPITPLTVCSTPGKSPVVMVMRKQPKKIRKKKKTVIKKVTKTKRKRQKGKKPEDSTVELMTGMDEIVKEVKMPRQITFDGTAMIKGKSDSKHKPLAKMRQAQSDGIVVSSPVSKMRTRMLITGVSTPSMTDDDDNDDDGDGGSDADDDIDFEILDDTSDEEDGDRPHGKDEHEDGYGISWLDRPDRSGTPRFGDQESLDLGDADTNRGSHRSMGSVSAISVSFVPTSQSRVVMDEDITIEDDFTEDTERLFDRDVLKQGNSRSHSRDTDCTPTLEVGDTSASMWISEAYFNDSESSESSGH